MLNVYLRRSCGLTHIHLEDIMTKIVAMSRKFPPDYRRRWYICRSKKKYLIRYEGSTWLDIRFLTLNHALNILGIR
jgi:hypothetical protein